MIYYLSTQLGGLAQLARAWRHRRQGHRFESSLDESIQSTIKINCPSPMDSRGISSAG